MTVISSMEKNKHSIEAKAKSQASPATYAQVLKGDANKNFSAVTDCTKQQGRNQNIKNFSAVTDCTKQQGRKPSIEAKAKSQASTATYAQVLKGGANKNFSAVTDCTKQQGMEA